MNLDQLLTKVKEKSTSFIILTGGVCSSIGKGVVISSLGVLAKSIGKSVAVIKFDPYLNVDPGTMSPLVHGEVFVTADGAETDLDLGHYERMIGVSLTRDSSVSSGQIFQELLQGEREGKFLGTDIQLIPHAVNTIKEHLLRLACKTGAELVLVEIGGTVGDIEGEIFLEAIRQLRMQLNPRQIMHGHLSYVPYLSWANEVKTKPTQHSVMLLKKSGLIPDALFLRTEQEIPESSVAKVALMCGVPRDYIFQVLTRKPVYQLFVDFADQKVIQKIQSWFNWSALEVQPNLTQWQELIAKINQKKPEVTVGMVVKYVGSNDPYISVVEALRSACYALGYSLNLVQIDAHALEKKEDDQVRRYAEEQLQQVHGIVVPGGFGSRGIEGKIYGAQYAREHQIPYLGLCLGMQLMLVEYARHVLGISDATSAEFDPQAANPVIALLDEQQHVVQKGGSMRLGSYRCMLKPKSLAHQAYGTDSVVERHRHRYEFNDIYRERFEQAGIVFSGMYAERGLVEISEISGHPFMLGVQFHPEFLSNPLKSHPLFVAFIKAVAANAK